LLPFEGISTTTKERNTMKETYQKTVLTRINNDKNHGWGLKDSMAVIEALHLKATGKEMSEEHKEMVASVVNPSAARQVFAKQGLLNKEAKKERTEKLFMQFDN
jgi:hypothetical protein